MKQAFSLLLALAMLAALAACGGSPAPAPAADSPDTADSAEAQDTATAAPEPTAAPMAQADVTMETQVLADHLGVKLTVSDWTYEPFETPEGDPNGSYSYTLTVENSSGKSLTLCRVEGEGAAKNVSILVPTMVNGHGFDSFLSPKDETINGDMSAWLDSYTIPDGESRSFLAYISEQLCPLDEHDPWLPVQVRQFYALYDSADVNTDNPGGEALTVDAEIVTSARRAYEVELADAGDVLYEDDLVTVYADRFYYADSPDAVENDWAYYTLDLYVHNKSDTMCNVALKDFTFNGAALESFYAVSGHAYAGSTFCIEPTFSSADMEALGINGLDGIESFHGVIEVTDGENVLSRTPVDLDSAWFENHSSSYTQEHPEA